MLKWLYKKVKKEKLSIVISTYNNVEFLSECIDSITRSSNGLDYEILLGIDGCNKTFRFVSKNKFFLNKRIKIYYFAKNVGPYLIKNTLALRAKHENILFFDSDDILLPNSAKKIVECLNKSNIVKFKFNNFVNKKDYKNKKNLQISPYHALGVFGIKKSVFIQLGGFLGWRCGADTEFEERCRALGINVYKTNAQLFLRRYHGKNITKNKKTGINSPLRNEYEQIIISKRESGLWELNSPPKTSPCARMNILKPVDIFYKNYNDEFIRLPIDNGSLYVTIKDLKSRIKSNFAQSSKEVFP